MTDRETPKRPDSDDRMAAIFDAVDTLLCAGMFAEVDALLEQQFIQRIPIVEMVAWLTATNAASHRLFHRKAYYEMVKSYVSQMRSGEYAVLLFDGLEGRMEGGDE